MEAVRTAPRPFLTVKEVMILLGCKEDFAYKTMRKINKESESQGYISIGSGKVNKHLFADKLQIPEEDIEQAIQYVAAQEVLQRATRTQWEEEAIQTLSRRMRQSMEGTQPSTGIRWMKTRRISLRICQKMRKNC